jgi:hypothetical protein
MIRALGNGVRNLEISSVEERHCAGQIRRSDEDLDRNKQGIIRCTISRASAEVTDALSDCPQNSLEGSSSTAVLIAGTVGTYST